jgi:hypothetical protein
MIYMATIGPQYNSPHILWDNILLNGAVTASPEAVTGLGAQALTQSTNDGWVCFGTEGTLTLDGPSQTADMAGFAGHTMAGKLVEVQYLVDLAWVTAGSCVPESNEPFMIAFTRMTSTGWRVRVTGSSFTVAVIYIGESLQIPGTIQIPHTPLHLAERVELVGGSESRAGQFLQPEIALYAGSATLAFEVQQPRFILDEFEAFRQWYNRGNAFFVASCPGVWPEDMGYCWRDGNELLPIWRDAVYMGIDAGVRVYRG